MNERNADNSFATRSPAPRRTTATPDATRTPPTASGSEPTTPRTRPSCHARSTASKPLATLELLPDTHPTSEPFGSECDYLAHALAAIIRHGEYVPADVPDALAQIIEFSAFRAINHTDKPLLEVEFYLLLPADGRVARFGPITCQIPNRAYRKTLRDNGDTDLARALLADKLGLDGHAAGHRATHALTRLLQAEAGWTQLAARLLATSGLTVLHQVAGNILWGDPLPSDIDPGFAELVVSTYSDRTLSWNPRGHASDCQPRQLCVDHLVANGGTMRYLDLEAAVAGTKVDDLRITIYSRDQQCGNAPVWRPCMLRLGDWVQQHPKAGRSLAAVPCPHCGGYASRVVRTPETPACLLCPDCRRMPVDGSPVFPDLYLRL